MKTLSAANDDYEIAVTVTQHDTMRYTSVTNYDGDVLYTSKENIVFDLSQDYTEGFMDSYIQNHIDYDYTPHR